MKLITVKDGSPVLRPETASLIAEFERQLKSIEEQKKLLKNAILAEMEEKGLIKIDTPELTITYFAPTDRERFDSKRFRELFPKTYDEFVTMSPIGASIRIKLKKGKKK